MTLAIDEDVRKAGMTRLRGIVTELDNITTNGFKTEEGGVVVSTEVKAEFDKLIAEQKDIRSTLAGFDEAKALQEWLDAPAAETKSVAGKQAVAAGMPAMERKSIGQLFTESDAYKNRDRSSGHTREDFALEAKMLGNAMVNAMERKDIYTAAGGTFTNFAFGTPQIEPIVPRAYRTQRVRDLFPVATTSANLIEYLRVLGYVDGVNNAAPVPERDPNASPANFGLKPHTSLSLQPAQSPIRTIAHYEVAHRNTLNDEPQLQSIIDTELLYGLRLAEDDQLLNGDGTGENILGILRTPGIQRYPGTPIPTPSPVLTGDTYVDAVRRAATRIMLAYYEPTGVVVHPFDWERMETIKDTLGNYVVAINVAIGAQKQIWQMPVVASPAMNQGTSLVGAYGLGAKVYDREQANIRVAEQHMDLFVRNAVAILAEERVGLTVSRPESFIQIDLTASTA